MGQWGRYKYCRAYLHVPQPKLLISNGPAETRPTWGLATAPKFSARPQPANATSSNDTFLKQAIVLPGL